MRTRWATAGILALALAGCSRPADVPASPHVVAHRPPTRKDVIAAVMASQSIELTVHPSCNRIGTDETDTTIGAYLSGFLAEFENKDAGNWLETKVDTAQSDTGVPVWRSEMIIRHSAGEDEWGWGVRFDVRQDDGAVVPSSFVCIGAG